MKKSIILTLILLAATVVVAGSAVTGGFSDGGGILYTEPVKSVIFSHKTHADEKRISCDRCHFGLFAMEALKAQREKDFTMESLYKGKYCGACHNGKAAFASDTQCARCHVRAADIKAGYVKGKASAPAVYKAPEVLGKGSTAVRFNHETHIAQSRCNDCHPRLFKIKKGANRITMTDHGRNRYCFGCHDGRKTFSSNDCSRCHATVPVPSGAILFGEGEKAVPFRHKTHAGTMQCADCHTKLFAYKKSGQKIAFADHTTSKDCFACHASTGKGKASYSCNLCHAKSAGAAAPAGPAQPILFGAGEKAVSFRHQTHAGTMQCGDCHTKLFAYKKSGQKIAFADHTTSKNCFACHASTGKGKAAYSCNLCHKSQAAAAPAGAKSSCLTCHTSASVMKAMVKPPAIPTEGEG